MPGNEPDAFARALAEQLAGKDAAASLQAALDERTAAHGPVSPEALEVLLTLVSEHARQKRPDAARAGLAELIRRGPPGAEAMAGSFYASFRDWAQAEEHYERALAKASEDEKANLLHAVGRTRLELGRLEEGRATLAEAARLGCSAAAVDLSDALALAGKVDEAKEVLDDARHKADQRWAIECSARLSALSRAGGKGAEAEQHARDAVMAAEELAPAAMALVLFELAATQAQLGKNAEALVALERALGLVEADSPRDDYACAQAWLRLGAHLLYGFSNRQGDALPYLNRALGALVRIAGEQSPECAEVLVQLSVANLRKGDVATAEGQAARAGALYERAYGKANRFSSSAFNLLGSIRLARGDQAGAKEALARVLEGEPKPATS